MAGHIQGPEFDAGQKLFFFFVVSYFLFVSFFCSFVLFLSISVINFKFPTDLNISLFSRVGTGIDFI